LGEVAQGESAPEGRREKGESEARDGRQIEESAGSCTGGLVVGLSVGVLEQCRLCLFGGLPTLPVAGDQRPAESGGVRVSGVAAIASQGPGEGVLFHRFTATAEHFAMASGALAVGHVGLDVDNMQAGEEGAGESLRSVFGVGLDAASGGGVLPVGSGIGVEVYFVMIEQWAPPCVGIGVWSG